MTRAELNTYIDTNITDKTAVDSLTPEDEGNALKEVADYVDELIIEKVVKISLTSADILDIFTTPIEVTPAVEGKLLVPRYIHQKYTHVTTPYTGGATWRIGLGTINTAFSVISAVIGSADNSQAIQTLTQNFSGSGISYEELNIIIGGTSANPTGGDGTLELFITYLEIDIT